MQKWMAFACVLVLALGGAAYAQECPGSGGCQAPAEEKACGGCDSAAKQGCDAPATMMDRLGKLEASAAKGCETSKARLAKLLKLAQVEDVAGLKTKVEACQQYAEGGCDQSKQLIATLDAAMAPKPAKAAPAPKLLSERALMMARNVKGGCGKSSKALQPLFKACGTGCPKSLVAMLKQVEASAAGGCVKSAAKLAEWKKLLPAERKRPAFSARVARLANKAGQCDHCKVTWAKFMKASGAETADALVAELKTWETKAGHGCAKHAGKIQVLEETLAKIAQANVKETGEPCCAGECSGCGDECGESCGSGGGCGKTTDSAPAEKPACGGGGCPSG